MPANTCMHAQCPPPSHERASVSMRDVHFPHVSERLEAHKEGKLGGHISAGAPVAAGMTRSRLLLDPPKSLILTAKAHMWVTQGAQKVVGQEECMRTFHIFFCLFPACRV
eukprot:1137395-Pelagomonas_calceolata.AAC.1